MTRQQSNQFKSLDILARLQRSAPYGLDDFELLIDAAQEICELRKQIKALCKETQ
jgi:hypothetical protein